MDGTTQVLRRPAIGIFQPSQERLEQLGAWFRVEYPGLLRFAYFVCGDAAQAEDLVQEAFVKLYRAGARSDEATIRAYARRTIVNLSRSAWRRRGTEQRALRHQEPGEVAPHDPGPRDEVWRALLTLSPKQRAVMTLRFYEDMSQEEVADALGMSVGTVKQHTDRAMKALRARLGERSES